MNLRLHSNNLGDEGVAGLVSSPSPPLLIWLDLQGNGISDDGIRKLVKASDRLTALTHLNQSGNNLSDDGAVLLARSPLLDRLTKLDLSSNHIGDRGAEALLEPALRNWGLRLLLHGAPFSGAGPHTQARLRQALGKRVEWRLGSLSW
jgi:hypothetical protein